MSVTLRILSRLCVAVLIVLAFGDSIDFIEFWRNPSAYGFGSEVAGFRYLSPTHFVASIVATTLGATTALVVPKLIGSEGMVLAARFGLASLVIALRYM